VSPEGRRGWVAGFAAIARALRSWRTLSVSLLSFSSGLPLGLVWVSIPDWMRDIGVDIRVVGLFTLTQAPWTFKYLWSPLMDRYSPGFLGRRRGWIAVTQVALFAITLLLAGVGDHPEAPWVVAALALAMAVAGASQDIALDAYAVEVLRREEHGTAVGLRTALYRLAMTGAAGLAIWLASVWSWSVVNAGLALLYLPMLAVTFLAPPPERQPKPRTLYQAVWLPFVGCMSRHRALEILAFVLLYKLADNLSQSLLRPFLNDMGFGGVDRGVSLTALGLLFTLPGTFLGGLACNFMGVGRALWVFGFLQIFSNVGYVLLTYDPGNRALMMGAMSFELLTTGLGMGAFGVLLLRITQKRFSATQYALYSSLFGLPRILAGPVTGFVVDALGWRVFFWLTMVAGIPGLLLLRRFAPWRVRDPEFTIEPPRYRERLSGGQIGVRAAAAGLVAAATAALVMGTLRALKSLTAGDSERFDLAAGLRELFSPAAPADWLAPLSILVVGLLGALAVAAVVAARHGNVPEIGVDEPAR
jgi:PAT family beta-lactamase induction signal transducer AmpG